MQKSNGTENSSKQSLEEKVKSLERQLTEKDKQIEKLINLLNKSEALEKAVNLIDENAKALTLSKKLKTEPNVNKHGAEHPRFNDNVKNEDLVADYKSGMILKELAEKYGLSIPGIRNRLIALGEYQAKYNTNSNQE